MTFCRGRGIFLSVRRLGTVVRQPFVLSNGDVKCGPSANLAQLSAVRRGNYFSANCVEQLEQHGVELLTQIKYYTFRENARREKIIVWNIKKRHDFPCYIIYFFLILYQKITSSGVIRAHLQPPKLTTEFYLKLVVELGGPTVDQQATRFL